MKKVQTNNAPQAVGPYSQAIDTGNVVYLSGQLGLTAEGEMVSGVVEQTHQAFKNMMAVLEEAGLGLENVVKTLVLLDDIADFQRVNEVYGQYFKEPYPARSAFAVKNLPLGGLVEIEVIAVRN
ncbi:RidA family protein [Fundicoccus culcitae]|uniref:RidA family protein n=1 Tax=Fundicoccus culcitae TaxID=2969821 RepID=A0ABY5P5A5_9LACT|nr:RidA family protein [Fundicoccus culcitae]UUX33790.1 RidA family protein [Fundicoccus culcitae]